MSRIESPGPPHWPESWPHPPGRPPVRAARAMVSSTDRYATDVGVAVLGQGGNAVDAAVAVSMALAVVNPEAGNLGGGGFLVLRAADGTLAALDYRSTAPGRAREDMYAAAAEEDASVAGPLAAAVPGTVRGLWEAHRVHGRLPWADLVQPAVELARGFRVTERFVVSFEPHIVEGLARFPSSAGIFLPGGAPPEPDTTFRQPDLARTLERIRDRGADGFYLGETADAVARAMEAGGGLVDRRDLSEYRAVWRTPLRFGYRGRQVVSMPPPSSGGVTLALTASILEGFDVGSLSWHGAPHVHLLAEAWKRAFADRNQELADPDFVDLPLDALLSPDYGAWRARDLQPGRSTPAEDVTPGLSAWPGAGHTTHFSVVDPDGNAVSNTTTVNTWYGGKWVAEGTGVLFNNDMDDFSTRPGQPNFFGLVQGAANAIAPGKRMLSAMTPSLLLDGRGELELVVGAPGGGTIITTVFQVISNLVDHGMSLADAVAAPRVHHQHLPDHVRYEPGGLPPDVVDALEGMGHRVVEHHEPAGDAHAVRVQADGTLEGVADPRRGGAAAGF